HWHDILYIMAANKPSTPIVPVTEVAAVLREFNPWWSGGAVPETPSWTRAIFGELMLWLTEPPAPRAVLLTGARQVGKTTLLMQAARSLLRRGISPNQIVYIT